MLAENLKSTPADAAFLRSLGARIKARRLELGLTSEVLAYKLVQRIDTPYAAASMRERIYNWERAGTRLPVTLLVPLARELRWSVDKLLGIKPAIGGVDTPPREQE